MAIYLDDQAVDLAGADLGAVVRAAQERLTGTGRLVVEVQVNGQPVVGDELGRRQAEGVGGAEVRLYSTAPRELALGALSGVRAALQEARQVQQEAAELLQQDQPRQAMQKISRMVALWQQTQQAVEQSARMAGVEFDTLEVTDDNTFAAVKHLAGQIREVSGLISSGDTVGLADALGHEWPQTVDRWDRLVETLMQRVEQGPTRDMNVAAKLTPEP